jgi:zinc protease
MFNNGDELAGEIQLRIRAFADKDLDEVAAAAIEAFARFEKEGISKKDLDRIKAGQETAFYIGLSSVLGKGFQLAQYNIFADDPGFVEKDIKNILAVTPEDVMRVYRTYIKDKPFIATSFVPKGSPELALEGSKQAEIVEEKIVQGAEESFDASQKAEYKRTPSTFDRTIEPPYGEAPEVVVPKIWEDQLKDGLKIYGIENREVPLVQFNIVIDGGQLLDDIKKVGVANLMARMMTQGTKNKTPEELEEAIQQLGASINVSADGESVRVSGNTLARNYPATIALVEEIILQPRWDPKEFELTKQSTINLIRQQMANPNAIANDAYNELLYGKDDIRSRSVFGTVDSVESITLDDLKAYYAKNISPSVARMHVVGALDKSSIVKPLANLSENWKPKKVNVPELKNPPAPKQSKVYFYDVPGAKQSVLRIGYPALAATDKDFYPATVTNYILGGGGFASRLTQTLREGKGYTYGINSFFSGSKSDGTFTISSGVRTNVTLESLQEVKGILDKYGATFSDSDLGTTKGFLIKSNARAFETAGAKLNMLENISTYGWDYDYVKQREAVVKAMTLDRIKVLSGEYLNPDKMIWLVIGDAQTQLGRLKDLGFGEPVLLNGKE